MGAEDFALSPGDPRGGCPAAIVSGWLRAELIYGLSIGVDDAALNDPNSLTHQRVL